MNTIVYQGVEGAFSHLTAMKAFGEGNRYCGLKTFLEMFEHLASGQADFAMVPIENSLIGSIYENYDLLNRYEMKVIGEHYTRIEHCLLAVPSAELKTIKKVFSHPKALEQCSRFFQQHPWMEAVVHMDTAAAAAEVAIKQDPSSAAIASAYAGELYHLDTLIKGIEDDTKNYTRFLTVTKHAMHQEKSNKCSLQIQLKHTPGSLAQVLMQFALENINLTKIESRPIKNNPFNYIFYVDFEFHMQNEEDIKCLLHKLKGDVQELKVLGFYKKETLWIS